MDKVNLNFLKLDIQIFVLKLRNYFIYPIDSVGSNKWLDNFGAYQDAVHESDLSIYQDREVVKNLIIIITVQC